MAFTLDVEFLKDRLIDQLNAQLLEAAEPYVEQALDKIEFVMREKLASNLIALVDQRIDFEQDKHQISIRIARS